MKTKTKTLSLMMAAVLLITATVFGTMAYLTSQDQVVNTFTVGSVAIKLDEADVKPDGTYETDHDSRVAANDYKLIPGHTYIKDPTVTVLEGSESSYVRMLVTISNARQLKEVFGDDFSPENYVEGWNRETWIPGVFTEDEAANTMIYEFRYKETVAAPDMDVVLEDLFDSFTVPGIVDNDNLAKLADTTVTVVAHAIQSDGFDSADAAWNAFGDK